MRYFALLREKWVAEGRLAVAGSPELSNIHDFTDMDDFTDIRDLTDICESTCIRDLSPNFIEVRAFLKFL